MPGWPVKVVSLQLSLGSGLSQGRGGQTRRQHGLKEPESETVGELPVHRFSHTSNEGSHAQGLVVKGEVR